LKFQEFYGQNNGFIGWLTKVLQVFAYYNLDDQEKFRVVASLLESCALQWWKNYKFKRRKKGNEKVRTWKKSRSKLTGSFCPPAYMLKHVPLLLTKNGSKSSCMNVHFSEGSPKSSCTLGLPNMLPLKELVFYEGEDERKEGLNRFDPPPIIDDYGDEEIVGFEDYVMRRS